MKLNEVTQDVASLKSSFKDLTMDFNRLENKLTLDIKDLTLDFNRLENKVDTRISKLENKVDTKISQLEITIEKAMNRNLKQTLYVMGFFLVVIKGFDFLEKFIK